MELLTNFECVALWSVIGDVLECFPEDTFCREYLESQYKIIGLTCLTHEVIKCFREDQEIEKFLEIRTKYFEESHKADLDQEKGICRAEERHLDNILESLYSKIDEEVIVTKIIRKFYRTKYQDLVNEFTRLKERREWESEMFGKFFSFEEVLPGIQEELHQYVNVGVENDEKIINLLEDIEELEKQKISDFLISKSNAHRYINFLIRQKNKFSKEEILKILYKMGKESKKVKKKKKKKGRKLKKKNKTTK